MKTILIDPPQSIWNYAVFYTAAFLVCFIILIAEGRRRKIPQFQWLIVIATGFVSFVFGCRIITYSREDWNIILSNQPLDHTSGLVMLGGLLVCVPCILIVKRLVRLNESVLDAYALVLPIGMCLQRVGCFLNGCCFGTQATAWGIQYESGTSAFYDHYSEGVIPGDSLYSLIIHPVQLYESLGCLISIFFLLRVRNRFRSPGSLFYLSGLTYYIVRFLTEFFRDSDAYAIEVPVWMGLNAIQWLMLALIIGSFLIIISKERSPQPDVPSEGPAFSLSHLFYFVALSIIFFFASKWLRPMEIFVVYVVLFTTAGYLLTELFKTITVPGFRIASLSLILLSLVMMSQTYPEQAASDSTRISYNTISVGALLGSQDLTMVASDCNGNQVSETHYQNKYRILGMGFSHTVQTGVAKSYTLGLSGYVGSHDEEVNGAVISDRPELTTYGVTPYGQVDYPIFGFGLGLHFGDMSFITSEPEITSVRRYSVYPQFYARFGRLNKFFGELNFARNFPSSFPGTVFQASLGFPLDSDKINGGAIRIGTSTSTGIFVSASIPMGKHMGMEPYFGFLGSPFMEAAGYDSNTAILGSLSLHYKFSKREIEP